MPKEQNVLSSQINQYLAADQSGFLATVEIFSSAPRSAACFAVSADSLSY
jgi:hypothetical protein